MQTPLRSASQAVTLKQRYQTVRDRMLELVSGLSVEDLSAQSMLDASPAKWHIGHTSWFFEAMILSRQDDYEPVAPQLQQIFNSYYESLGARVDRHQRGLITRPSVGEVLAYRQQIDRRMMMRLDQPLDDQEQYLFELGLNHERQHQELLVQDLIHLMSCNPLHPVLWDQEPRSTQREPAKGGAVHFSKRLTSIGSTPAEGFAFDNEMPRHRHWLEGYKLDADLVTNGQWIEFIDAGGYQKPEYWLSDGWAFVQEHQLSAPLYWQQDVSQQWMHFTGEGLNPVRPDHPVRHVSYYEADAYARWRGARLPTEAEWEHAARLHPELFSNLDTEVWQWTCSAYLNYPGFKPTDGTASEYNGKFMSNQMVLRGGSYATARDHVRTGYRNFYYPHQRWALIGLRLAYDLSQGEKMDDSGFESELVAGLSSTPKTVSPKWFYDAEGSRLFEDITKVPEYYPTRQEAALLRDISAKWAADFGDNAVLVEFGSGASEKTRILLDAAKTLSAYVPLDISESQLNEAAQSLRQDCPHLGIHPVVADFENLPALPEGLGQGLKIGFFPGSTIGNLDRQQAVKLLSSARKMLGADARFILGVDLIKDRQTLESAYDDAEGVTARFNKNLLVRANEELGADFDLDGFEHRAIWNEDEARIEMHLAAKRPMKVTIGSVVFRFEQGETIHTESSRKFDEARLNDLARESGWKIAEMAISPQPSVALALLEAL